MILFETKSFPFLFYFLYFKEKFHLLARFFLYCTGRDDKQDQLQSSLIVIEKLSK